MRISGRRLVVTLAAAVSLTSLAGCSESGITEDDAYQIGCPAVDAAVAGGSLGTKAAVAGLEKVREQPDLSKRTTKFLDTAVAALKTTDPNEMPSDAKAVLLKGCADHGYPLRNLERSR